MIDLSAFNGSAWLAEPDRLQQAITRVLAAGRCFTPDEVKAAMRADRERADGIAGDAAASLLDRSEFDYIDAMAADVQPKVLRAVKGKVGILPIWGPVQQRQSSELMKAGGTSIDFASRAFDKLMADPQIGAVVLHMDTPGGSSFGTPEFASKIANARGKKPIYAMVDSVAASAGYWIASAADMIICTPSGIVGSVGVYVMHVDQSKAMEAEGVKVTMISAGKYKTELAPYGELSADAKANQQAYVDELYSEFVNTLKANRNTTADNVRTNYGQGRVVTADNALAAGMVDRVMPFDELMARLTGGASSGGSAVPAAASIDAIRLRHQQRSRAAT